MCPIYSQHRARGNCARASVLRRQARRRAGQGAGRPFFIYRDPRDIVVSEAHYLREMTPLAQADAVFPASRFDRSRRFRCRSMGYVPPVAGIDYPDVAARFERYQGWMTRDDCFTIRLKTCGRNGKRRSSSRWQSSMRASGRRARRRGVCAEHGRSRGTAQIAYVSQREKGGLADRNSRPSIGGDLMRWRATCLIQLGYEPDHQWANGAGSLGCLITRC